MLARATSALIFRYSMYHWNTIWWTHMILFVKASNSMPRKILFRGWLIAHRKHMLTNRVGQNENLVNQLPTTSNWYIKSVLLPTHGWLDFQWDSFVPIFQNSCIWFILHWDKVYMSPICTSSVINKSSPLQFFKKMNLILKKFSTHILQ